MERTGRRWLVACSGGPDSTALLYGLARLSRRWSLELRPVVIDHGLRDTRSEVEFVQTCGEELGLPVECVPVSVRVSGGSLQRAARDARRLALTQVAARHGARLIALGHTSTDQAETLIMRLLRGAGTRGLAAMERVRLPWVRPLLGVSRAEVMEYLEALEVAPQTDPSNSDPRFLRTKLRAELWPVLQSVAPGFESRLARAADRLRADATALERMATRALESAIVAKRNGELTLSIDSLRSQPPELRPHLFRAALVWVRGDATDIEAVHYTLMGHLLESGAGPSQVDLPGAVVRRQYGQLVFVRPVILDLDESDAESIGPPTDFQDREIHGPGCYRFADGLVTVDSHRLPTAGGEALEGAVARLLASPGECFDKAALRGPIVMRRAQQGERMSLLGLRGTKKVSDVWIDAKVPRAERHRIPVLSGPDGILWVVGVRRSALAPVTGETREVIRVQWLQ